MRPAPNRVEFHNLCISRRDDAACAVGRLECGDFASVPAIGADIIEILRQGHSISETEALLEASGRSIDVGDFVEAMRAMGFIKAIDGVEFEDIMSHGWNAPIGILPALRILHSRTLDFVIASYAVWAGIFAWTHGLLLSIDNTLVSGSVLRTLMAAVCVGLLFLLAHELGHLTAAWSVGIPARWHISTRFNSIVAETEAPAMWSRPRRERMRFYLAGIRSDIVLGASALLIQGVVTEPAAIFVLRFAVMTAFAMLLFQLQVFLRTDFYYVLMDALNTPNLNADAIAYLRSLVFPSARHPQTSVSRTVRAYAVLQVASASLLCVAFVLVMLPTIVVLWRRSVEHVVIGLSNHDTTLFLEGAIPILLEIASLTIFVYIVIRDRLRKHGIRPSGHRTKKKAE